MWVQDYQLQLVPGMLRERRPDLRIGFFLHIPFPPSELFAQLPWRREIIEGLLGADLVGFHTDGGAQNFLALDRPLPRHAARCHRCHRAVAAQRSAPGDRRRVPDLHRHRRVRRHRAHRRGAGPRARDPRRPRRPQAAAARCRPARLHQGHRRAPQGVHRAARRRLDRARRGCVRADRHAQPRERRGLPAAARRDRPHGGPPHRRRTASWALPRSSTSTSRSPARTSWRSTSPPT